LISDSVTSPSRSLILGRTGHVGRLLEPTEAAIEVEVLHLTEIGLAGTALGLAIFVDVGVGEDAVQPRLQVGPGGEGVVGPVGLEHRLLDEVLGVGGVAGHAHRRRIELTRVRHGVALEVGLICHRAGEGI
jgi:hypothetical protein